MLKRPNAFVPLAISAALLAALLGELLRGTLVRQPDEGALAHLFQILMPLQISIIAWFAIVWLPKDPKPALRVLLLQGGAMAAVLAIVYFRHL